MIFIIIGLLLISLITIIHYVKREGDWKEYKPLGECLGFTDWLSKNKGTWERERFEYVVSVVVSIVTTVITTTYLINK